MAKFLLLIWFIGVKPITLEFDSLQTCMFALTIIQDEAERQFPEKIKPSAVCLRK